MQKKSFNELDFTFWNTKKRDSILGKSLSQKDHKKIRKLEKEYGWDETRVVWVDEPKPSHYCLMQ